MISSLAQPKDRDSGAPPVDFLNRLLGLKLLFTYEAGRQTVV